MITNHPFTVELIGNRRRRPAIRPFSDVELAKLLDAAAQDLDHYPFFLTLARTGLRPGEAFALRWSDFDFTKREILVERGLSDGKIGTTKTETVRCVDMSQELAGALQALLTRRKEETLRRGWTRRSRACLYQRRR